MSETGLGSDTPSPGDAGAPVPSPAVPVDLDTSTLPPLEYPWSPQSEVLEKARARRRGRLRIEVAGGGAMVIMGLLGYVAIHNSVALLLALGTVAVLVAYELLVSSLE